MERARAEWQTGPSCSHGVVLDPLEVAAVLAGPAHLAGGVGSRPKRVC